MAEYPEISPKSLIGRAATLRDKLRGGVSSVDDNISLRMLMRLIETTYASVLQDDLDARVALGQPLNPQLGFDYNCECLEDAVLCGGSTEFMVKKVKLPKLAQYNGKPGILFFGTDGVSFTRVNSPREAKSAIQPQAFKEVKPAYVIRSTEALIYLPALYWEICFVDMSIIPEIPSLEAEECFDIWSEEYPMLEYLWKRTMDKILGTDGEVLLKTEAFKDKINDSRGDVENNR